jgi:protein TonB
MMIDTFDTETTRIAVDALVEETLRKPLKAGQKTHWITPDVAREKHPEADLKLKYRKTFWISFTMMFVVHATVAIAFPEFRFEGVKPRLVQSVITMEDIPETRQIRRPPPPPRPSVPIETESLDVPDDVTIESTDLDLDDMLLDLPLPPRPGSRGTDDPDEEILDFWAIEEAPLTIQEVYPVYPEVARRAGLEGTVFLQYVVGRDGKVKQVTVIRGPEIFRRAAEDAVMQFVFQPALQNDKPVSVRMTRPIRFRLADGG